MSTNRLYITCHYDIDIWNLLPVTYFIVSQYLRISIETALVEHDNDPSYLDGRNTLLYNLKKKQGFPCILEAINLVKLNYSVEFS